MNYFEYHGASIWDKRREILENAVFCDDNFKIQRLNPKCSFNEIGKKFYSDEWIVNNETSSWKFIYQNKLYQFLTNQNSKISSFFELNTSKKDCLNGKFGGYFTFGKIE